MLKFSKQQKAVIIGSWLGWALDGYDLVLMLFVISSVSQLFFPTGNVTLSLLATFATYAITLIMRPFGGAIFGSFGDRMGRKKSMIITITGFSVVTFSTGLLPTWNMVGVMAPILLIVLRILQGVFAGGEWGSGAVITMESVSKSSRGLVSGFIQSGFPFGFLLASVAFEFVSLSYPKTAFLELGWRIMFFTGIIPSILALFLRLKMGESEMWLSKVRQQKINRSPLQSVIFGRHRKAFFLSLIITTGLMYSYYASIGFMPTFLQEYLHLGQSDAAGIMISATASSFFGYIFSGWLSQKIGRIRAITVFSGLTLILSFPLFSGLYNSVNISWEMIYASIIVFLATSGFGPLPAFLSERFPTEIRNSASGFVFNAGLIIGSWAPLIAIELSTKNESVTPMMLALGLAIGSVITIIGLKVNPETRDVDLHISDSS